MTAFGVYNDGFQVSVFLILNMELFVGYNSLVSLLLFNLANRMLDPKRVRIWHWIRTYCQYLYSQWTQKSLKIRLFSCSSWIRYASCSCRFLFVLVYRNLKHRLIDPLVVKTSIYLKTVSFQEDDSCLHFRGQITTQNHTVYTGRRVEKKEGFGQTKDA